MDDDRTYYPARTKTGKVRHYASEDQGAEPGWAVCGARVAVWDRNAKRDTGKWCSDCLKRFWD